jgi:hypothetical protein
MSEALTAERLIELPPEQLIAGYPTLRREIEAFSSSRDVT